MPVNQGPTLESVVAGLDREIAASAAATAPRGAPAPRTGAAEQQFVLFRMEGAQYLVPSALVLEVGRREAMTPVPGTPDWLIGVMNLRGDIIPVIDLCCFLGLSGARADRARTLVVHERGLDLTLAVLVDGVAGMRRLAESDTQPIDASDRLASYLVRGARIDGQLAAVIDLGRVLAASEMRRFSAA